MPRGGGLVTLLAACAMGRAVAARLRNASTQPLPPVPGARVAVESKEILEIVKFLEEDLKKLKEGAAAPQELVLSWLSKYNDNFDNMTSSANLDNRTLAREIMLTSVAERRCAVETELYFEEQAWNEEKKASLARKDAEQLRADALLKCAQARRAKETIPDGCEKDGVGEDVLKAALSRNAIFLQTTAEPEPFALRVLKRTLEDLDDEADEYGSKKELWHMHGARSERYRTVITDMSETHEAMEDYTDFRHGQLVAELGQQRDRLCQLEIMPALYAKGEVEDHPDFTPINVLKDEAFAIHSAMRYHQEFHRSEQRELWKSFYVLRAALDKWQDVSNEPVCPEGTRYFLAHNGTGACANDNCTDGFVFHRDKLACVNTTCGNGTH